MSKSLKALVSFWLLMGVGSFVIDFVLGIFAGTLPIVGSILWLQGTKVGQHMIFVCSVLGILFPPMLLAVVWHHMEKFDSPIFVFLCTYFLISAATFMFLIKQPKDGKKTVTLGKFV